jgi:cytochrome c oxidase subunit II
MNLSAEAKRSRAGSASSPRCPGIRSSSVPLLMLLAISLAGCEGDRVQSVLHPASWVAEEIAWLWWVMLITGGIIQVGVTLLVIAAIVRRKKGASQTPPLGTRWFILGGGLVMPVIVLIPLMLLTLHSTVKIQMPETGLTIEVTGHLWWWEIRYPDLDIVDANELHIPVGVPVRLALKSADIIHSFWVPSLHGKMDLIPGHTNAFWIQADRAGVYRGQCAEFCGLQHAHMAFMVVALEAEDFEVWVARRQAAAPEPETAELHLGRRVFFEAGCDNCHAIRGTAAEGRIGPDLSAIGSRRTIGAGTLVNNRGNLGGWTVNPQAIKPGNLMPRTFLEPNDLHALVSYMESLK